MKQSVHDYTEEDSMRDRMTFCFGIFFLMVCLPVGIGLLLYWYWSDAKRIYGKEDKEEIKPLKGKVHDYDTDVLEDNV
tara:strand:- start:19 stop:252 length:234 start_codon:yes stop_codon:yes gene_type:complete